MTQPQRGGTLLGLIIGLLVGLGAALAVAVYVTKVPVPFMNKGNSRTPEQDAAETRKNKDWDPNAALHGKNPARPASAAASGAVSAAPAASAPAAVASSPAKPASAPAKSETKTDAKSADPLGDLAKAKSATPPAAPVAPAVAGGATEPFLYFVQVGAFRTQEDADAQRAKLSLIGLEAKVTEREQSGRTVYRVRLGPFDRKEDADKQKERLDAGGMESALVRVQR